MGFRNILDQIQDALNGDDDERLRQQQGYNQQDQFGNVIPASQDPYGDPADQQGGYNNYNNGQFGNVMPASQDPLGDPADQELGYGNVLPASQDPLGDPADQEAGFGNVMPASQDPLGDPADQEQHQGGGLFGLFGRR